MFQRKIIEKYLSQIDKELLTEKYALYRSIFANKEKQENIRNSKEEQYQEGFIRDLFCSVLDYTINPEANYNILTELKNESKSNSKKSDGAIIINNEVKAVIELKGTDTQDLDKVAFQAFSYKNHHEKCNYVIVSNFERLRLYVETQIEYTEFNLFNLSKDSFDLFYLLLQLENITNDIPLKLKHETLTEEKEITNNFYSDYSILKRNLFEDLVENNPDIDKLLLFKKTQKLLDRILFILFCEDRNLLPTNSTIGIINDYKKLKELGYYQPLYNVFKTFFDRIDQGFKHDTDKSKDVFAYNGGLFKPDETLDSVIIGDDVLYIYVQRLANYDFQSQISVDILGRIFENSLTEIEEVQHEIENEKNGIKTENNNIGKRKKDGVFYTPEYITKYIVENTIGKLCEAKKEELKINDSEYTFDKKFQKKTIEQLDDRLNKYREWLLSLKILDCACGSGAFLNSALRELRKEHTLIDYFWSKIHKNELNFSQIDNSILENNLYGVDINDDSIEITKLSLWLHTATRNRKLTTLNDKIKCGNSLIDDPDVAGEKAFNWEKEFPEVFENGGFDVVIGNPPYIPTEQIPDKDKSFYEKNYKSAFGRINIYPIFYEKGINLLKDNGLLGYITPYTLLKNQYYIEARKLILNSTQILNLIDFSGIKVFQDATVDSIILILQKKLLNNYNFIYTSNIKDFVTKNYKQNEVSIDEVKSNDDLSFSNIGQNIDFKKLYKNCLKLDEIVNFKQGVITGNNKEFISKNKTDISKKVLTGANFNRYYLEWAGDYLYYDINRLHRPRTPDIFEQNEKLLLRQTGSYPICMIDRDYYYTLDTVHNGKVLNSEFDIKYLLTLINSKLLRFIYDSSINETGKVFAQVKIIYINPLPIKDISKGQQKPFIELADKMLSLNEDLQKKINRFISRIKETYSFEKITQNLESFYHLSFADFLKELSKQKVKLSMKQKDELEDYFDEYVKDISALKETIEKTDKEINSCVYSLYNLTDEEITIIESNYK